MMPAKRILQIIRFLGLLSLCMGMKGIWAQESGFELWKIQIHGIKGELRQSLYGLVEPDPPSRWFGVIPVRRLLWKDTQSTSCSQFRRFLVRKFAEPPAYVSREQMEAVAEKMQLYLFQKGYLDAQVQVRMDTLHYLKRRVEVRFEVKPGQPYQVGKFVPVDSPLPLRFFIPYLMDHPVRPRKPFSYDALAEDRKAWQEIFQRTGRVLVEEHVFRYELDTNQQNKTVDVYMLVRGDSLQLRSYRLRRIRILENPPICLLRSGFFTDSIVQMEPGMKVPIVIYTREREFLNWHIVADRIPFRDTSLQDYPRLRQIMTNGLLGLAPYSYLQIFLERVPPPPQDTLWKDWVDMYICLKREPVQSLFADLEGSTGTATIAGIRLHGAYVHRNLFRRATRLETGVSFSTEFQILADQRIFQLWTGEAQGTLEGPGMLLVPHAWQERIPGATTRGNARWLFERRPEFTYHQLVLEAGYQWKAREDYVYRRKPLVQHVLSPFLVYLIRTRDIAPEYQQLLETNFRLRKSFEDQLVAGSSYQLVVDQVYRGRSRYWYLSLGVETSGNFLALLERAGIQVVPFTAQFFRSEMDLRRYIRFFYPRNTMLVIRTRAGILFPYGRSVVAPYLRQFYVGGSGSMRAWTVRSLGPGSAPYQPGSGIFNERTGDILLEGNLEYRIGTGTLLEIALFADAGNVWLLRPDSLYPGGEWDWQTWWQDVGIAGGIGLRINMVYFLLRIDVAFRLWDPALPLEERLIPLHWWDHAWQRKFREQFGFRYPFWSVILALGYPF